MKRYFISLSILFVMFITSAQAQTPTAPVAGQRQGGPSGRILQDGQDRRVTLVQLPTYTFSTTWWTNTALVTRLGLTDAQKSRIEGTFEAHRQNLATSTAQLEKEELQLAKLLEAEAIDRGTVTTQINRVIQARGEVERTNSAMMLEMREQLTRAQWSELQASQPTMWFRRNSGDLQIRTLGVTPPTEAPAGTRGGARGGGQRGANVQQ